MARWEPNARERLQRSALELFGERGYEQTTVEDIASRAGLTKRTFFRHFADKREVLFDRTDELVDLMATTIAEAPADAAPIDAIAAAAEAAAALIEERSDLSRARQRVIAASPELRERELVKFASMADRVHAALSERGVPEPDAELVAEAGITVLRVAYERWSGDDDGPPLPEVVRSAMATLRGVAASA